MQVRHSYGWMFLALVLSSPVLSQQSAADLWNRSRLTGDWNGARTRLEKAGIRINAHYTTESAANTSGGLRQTGRYTQQLDLETLFDLQQLLGIHDARVQFTLTDRAGRSLSADALHNQFSVQELYGAGQNFRLAELNYRQEYMDHAVAIQLGWSPLGDDLARLPNFCKFQNGVICGHINAMTVNSGAHNFPTAQWGGQVKWRPGGGVWATAGVYLNNPNAGNKDEGFNLSFQHDGKFIPVEVGIDTGQGEGELPGRFIAGAYRNTARTPDVLTDINGNSAGLTGEPLLSHNGRSGGYLMASQKVFRESANSNRGLSVGGVYIRGDRDTARFTYSWAAGAVYQGTFRGRDDDFVSIMYAHATTNPRLTQYQRDRDFTVPGIVDIQTFEAISEIDYGARMTPWLMLRPNLQYVERPGGAGKIPDAFVIGLYTQVTF